ncbi:MAG: D-alanyl-D-alanine carboxypeptidase [Candidatus Omnitrophica bacterium]|nr:D-alanyl-D-alanine carboxypeptidase [Candidatus Omnitrophota bacterium]
MPCPYELDMNKKKYHFKYGCIVFAVLFVFAGCSTRQNAPEININAKCAVIMETKNGNVLFAKNDDEQFPPASTAKIMTAIVATESMPLDTKITASKEATDVEPVVAGLKPGVKYSLRDLLAAALVRSGNDAARVIAEGVSGTEDDFSYWMNDRAEKLGMKDTYFANASGLPTGVRDEQFVTARDLALLMKDVLKNEIVMEMLSKKTANITGSDGKAMHFKTVNRTLLNKEKALWGKTGYTKEAKRTFVGVDASVKPRIIVAVLQSDDLWEDLSILKRAGLELYEENHRSIFLKISDFF